MPTVIIDGNNITVPGTVDGIDVSVLDAAVIKKALLTERGSVIFRNATIPAELLHGTDGQVLTTKGHGVDPIWAAAGVSEATVIMYAMVFGG